MADASSLRALLEAYCAAWAANDRDAWLATFAPNATQEDPVGEGVRHGHDEIGGFWDSAMSGYDALTITPRGIFILGDEAAMEWTIRAHDAEGWLTFDGVDVFTFTPGGLISSVRAYWDREQRLR